MKKMFMCVAGAMMVLSLAACTPTTEKTEETVGQMETSAPGGKQDKVPDADAPVLDIVSIYHFDDSSKMVCEMDGVEGLDVYTLTEKLVEYKVLPEGTEVVDFATEGESSASEAAGPGAGPGAKVEAENTATFYESATLDLSEEPTDDAAFQAIADTICENLNVTTLTIKVNGEEKVSGMKFQDVK